MKTIKIIFILAAVYSFTSLSFSAEPSDCSHLKIGSHKWIMCNLGSKKYNTSEVAYNNSSKTNEAEKFKREKCKTIEGCWKKIKD